MKLMAKKAVERTTKRVLDEAEMDMVSGADSPLGEMKTQTKTISADGVVIGMEFDFSFDN